MTSKRRTARKPTPTPVKVVEKRNVFVGLSLFDYIMLPFLYLEGAVKYVFNYINERYPLK